MGDLRLERSLVSFGPHGTLQLVLLILDLNLPNTAQRARRGHCAAEQIHNKRECVA
jgi:hypothetical protein